MKKTYYVLKIFKRNGDLYKTFIMTDYQNVINVSDDYYNKGHSYSLEVVK